MITLPVPDEGLIISNSRTRLDVLADGGRSFVGGLELRVRLPGSRTNTRYLICREDLRSHPKLKVREPGSLHAGAPNHLRNSSHQSASTSSLVREWRYQNPRRAPAA